MSDWVTLSDPRPVVVSWGAGVQSTAIALLVERGELPRPAAWVFADTGGEPEAIYAHVERWRPRLEALGGFHVVRNPKETLPEHIARGGGSRIPFHIQGDDGRRGPIPKRGCTRDFKTKWIDRYSRSRFGKLPMSVSWQGISLDEVRRAKADGRTCYPLLELRMSRVRCLELLRDAGEPVVKSACTFCPYRSNSAWASLTDAEVEAAALVEDDLRRTASVGRKALRSVPSLHPSGLSVRERPWLAAGGAELDMMAGDCGGVCFV